jgi:hypothetical protein
MVDLSTLDDARCDPSRFAELLVGARCGRIRRRWRCPRLATA